MLDIFFFISIKPKQGYAELQMSPEPPHTLPHPSPPSLCH